VLWLSICALASGCAAIVRPEPIQCTDWTLERFHEYETLVNSEQYPEVAQMILEWNEVCLGNWALAGREPIDEPFEKPWWKPW
jgi:hypothetical protein